MKLGGGIQRLYWLRAIFARFNLYPDVTCFHRIPIEVGLIGRKRVPQRGGNIIGQRRCTGGS